MPKPRKPYTVKDGITQSILSTWLTCRVAAKYMLEGWESPTSREPLEFGNLFHWILEKNYDLIREEGTYWEFDHLAKIWLRKVGKKLNDPHKLLAMAEALYDEYYKYWVDDFERNWIGVESQFDIVFNGYRLRGMRDGIFRAKKDKPWLLETKTPGQIAEGTLSDTLAFDLQNLYYLTASEIETGENIAGVLYNLARRPQLRRKKEESKSSFMERIVEDVIGRPEHYFKRFEVKYTKKRKQKFKDELMFILDDFHAWTCHDPRVPTYKSWNCVKKWNCEFLPACAQGSLAGYTQTRILHGELAA